ncbi:Fpg/Nei family DNA glycosylase [Rothia sp. ND6WE1A]|uniref:Fpg/Nei family DNA glycosylase n=1 Tax=Rothia sp. ND6WE1A TaxID=1848190 RepID=UPI0008376760|nr:DNA-formamidopyrimidine glycosylase family protein [Rothia sp. ND6WE1A]
MPEGHSIHRLARQFNDVFAGQVLQLSSPQGRFVDGAQLLDGHRLEEAFAHGKHLFLRFDNDLYLNVHLGIYGAWNFGGDQQFRGASSIGAPRKVGEFELTEGAEVGEYSSPPPPKPTVRIRIVSAHGWADLIGPTVCRTLTADEKEMVRAQLGADPLDGDANPHQFFSALSKTARPIGVVLMDQKIISGIGNIFRAEVLYRQQIDPFRPAKSLSVEERHAVWEDAQKLLQVGVELGRIVTTEEDYRPGIPLAEAWPEHANYVYQRQGQVCFRCGEIIRVQQVAARNLFWCPGCQN